MKRDIGREILRVATILGCCWLLCSPLAAQQTSTITEQYRAVAERLITAALADEEGWNKLVHLTTQIGHRLSGSEQLQRATQWAHETMKTEGLHNVRSQPVTVPRWVRGREEAVLEFPFEKRLAILGLGGSVGTPPEGLSAPVVVVTGFEELERLGRSVVSGKIVVYAVPWEGYGKTVQYRSSGASRAARLGAVAVLVRSATGRSLYTPHTGGMAYEPQTPKIPAAALTVEDALWFERMAGAGQELRVRLYMEARTLADTESANVIGEIRGRESADEVVVLGGHLDSWDVGQGAHDDGVGVMATWHAVTLMHRLGLQPKRTIRVVLFTNEENGLRGGTAYHESVRDQIGNHVAAIEMDGGAEKPVGFGLGFPQNSPGADRALSLLQQIGRLLAPIEAGSITLGGGGADIGPLMRDGVPGLGLRTVGEHYFDWHHTHADTLDKVNIDDFRRCLAALAVTGFILADMPERLAPTQD